MKGDIMSKKIEVLAAAPSVLVTLESARAAVVVVATEFKGKTGEVIGAYAKAMCAALDLVDSTGFVTTKWYELKGKLKAPVTKERAAFKAAMAASMAVVSSAVPLPVAP